MKQISYNAVKQNTRLTDFECMKELVINHRAKTKQVPKFNVKEETNKPLFLYF